MNKLPTNIKPLELIRTLNRFGFVEKKGKGSHHRLVHPDGRWTQIAVHPKPLPTGTLRKILHQAKLTIEELGKKL